MRIPLFSAAAPSARPCSCNPILRVHGKRVESQRFFAEEESFGAMVRREEGAEGGGVEVCYGEMSEGGDLLWREVEGG